MTKKQLMQALAILDDEDKVLAVYKGKYSTSECEAYLSGIKILFKQGLPKAVILVDEYDEDLLEVA